MNLNYNDEQKQFQDLLSKFVQKDYAFERRRQYQEMPEGFSRKVWAQFAEMGLLSLPFSDLGEEAGAGVAEMLLTMTAIGNGLVVEPYLQTVVMAGGAIARAGNGQQKELLAEIGAGRLLAATAFLEPGAGFDAGIVNTTAQRQGGHYVISGSKAVVVHGGQAGKLVVSARTPDAGPSGISLFLVDRTAAGVAVRDYRTIDGLRGADIRFDAVRVPASSLLGAAGAAQPIIDAVMDAAVAALCAEAVGIMETLNALTLSYLKERRQFGQPIGSFQALQHRAVDMFMHAEQSRSMAWLAALHAFGADQGDAGARARAVSAAKVQIGHSGRWLGKEAIQLHGGMGMTLELPVAHYAKRLTMIDFHLGDSAYHLARFLSIPGHAAACSLQVTQS